MALVTDSFTGAGGTLLDAHAGEVGAIWTKHPASAARALVLSNANRLRADGSASGRASYLASGTPTAAEYDVQATFRQLSTATSLPCILGRYDAAADTGYRLSYVQTSTLHEWHLDVISAGAATNLVLVVQALTLNQDYTVVLKIRDARKSLLVNGVEIGFSTDNTVTAAGKAGVGFDSVAGSDGSGIHLDSFSVNPVPVGASRMLMGVGL